MNNSNTILFKWTNKKLSNLVTNNSISKTKVLVLHHGPDGNAESSPFWRNLEISGKEYTSNNNMTITFKGFNGSVSKMIEYLDNFNNKKLYKNYDAIVSTVLNSSTYGELNPKEVGGELSSDYNEKLKDVTIASKLNIIGRAIPLFTFNTVSEKVDSAIKYIGNGKIGEEKMGKKLAIMAVKYAIDAVNMNNVSKFNSRTLQDEAFAAIVQNVTETIDLDGDSTLESEEIPVEETEITEYEEENKITQLKLNTIFDINLLENMTKDNEIFNFFKDYANKLFDKIIIYSSEENNSAFESRINGIKRIFKEEKINIFYKIDDIDNALFDTEINYGIISLQQQNSDKMLELIDDLKEDNINILFFGVCDLSETLEKDVEYSFISAASGTKPNEQINNVLSSLKDFVSKLKKNNTSFVRNLHNKTSRAISETTTTGISLNNNDTTNKQLISLNSIRESLNLNVINTAPGKLLSSLKEQYPTNVDLTNQLFSWIALKNSSNNGQGYTIQISKYNSDHIKYIIDKIVDKYADAFNYIFSNKEDWTNTKNDNLKIILKKIYNNISFKDYFDIEFIVHNAEKLGFTHSEIAEQNIQNTNGIRDRSKIFSFYHLFNNTSGINEKDKIDKYLAIPLVKDVINYLNEICKSIAIVRLGVPLGKARKFDKDDRDALYYNRGTRKKKCAWCNAVKETITNTANETINYVEETVAPIKENVVEPVKDYYNEGKKIVEDIIAKYNFNNPCGVISTGSNLIKTGDFFVNILPENLKKLVKVKKIENNSCIIFGLSGEITYTYYETQDINDLLESGELKVHTIDDVPNATSRDEVYEYLKKIQKFNFSNKHLLTKGKTIPPKNFWGPLQQFFYFVVDQIILDFKPVKYYVSTGGELSNKTGISLNTEVGLIFPNGGYVTIRCKYKVGKNLYEKYFKINVDKTKVGSSSTDKFRVTIQPKEIVFKESLTFSPIDIISLLKLNDKNKTALLEILTQVDFGLKCDITFNITLEPFIAMGKDGVFVGITVPKSKFGISNLEVILPNWAREIPGFGSGNNDYFIKCIKDVVEKMNDYKLPCFEINTG